MIIFYQGNVFENIFCKNSAISFWIQCVNADELLHKAWGPFYWHGLTLIPAWISNYIHYKVWDEITYPFPNANGGTVEVWEWMSNFMPHFTGHVIAYPECKNLS